MLCMDLALTYLGIELKVKIMVVVVEFNLTLLLATFELFLADLADIMLMDCNLI